MQSVSISAVPGYAVTRNLRRLRACPGKRHSNRLRLLAGPAVRYSQLQMAWDIGRAQTHRVLLDCTPRLQVSSRSMCSSTARYHIFLSLPSKWPGIPDHLPYWGARLRTDLPLEHTEPPPIPNETQCFAFTPLLLGNTDQPPQHRSHSIDPVLMLLFVRLGQHLINLDRVFTEITVVVPGIV